MSKDLKKDLRELMKISGMDEIDITNQIKDGYSRGHLLTNNIRKEFETEDKLFNNQKKNKSKIGDNTYYSVYTSLMAREYVDKPTSEFQPSSPAQIMPVKNLNAAYDTDANTVEYETLKYLLLSDKYKRGVGIDGRKGWDGFKKMPKKEAIDPRLAIFDPDGDYVTGDYEFFGYEIHNYINNVKEKGFFNLENISKRNAGDTNGPDYTKQRDQDNADLLKAYGKSKSDPAVRFYYHFDTFKGQRALVVTGNQQKEIVFVKLYKTIKGLASFTDIFAFRYWRPDRNNPFGLRIAKLGVADLQRVKAEMANLRLDKSKAELYPMYTYNTRLIKNKADLNFGFNKLVPTTPLEGESLSNAIAPIQRDVRADNSYILDESLDGQVESITGVNKLATGSSPERREAATTNKIIQGNTDITLAFNAKINALGEEASIRTRLAGMIEKMEDGDKKLIYIQTGFGQLPRELGKKDFALDLFIKIKIETKVEIDERNLKDRIAYGQMIGFLQALPSRPESAILNTYRNYGRSWGMSEINIEMELPATAQELVAQTNIGLLLQGDFVKVQQNYDPDTHLLALQAAGQGDNVEMYKYGLLKLKQIKGITAQPEQGNESVANNLAAQAGASAANEATNLAANQ